MNVKTFKAVPPFARFSLTVLLGGMLVAVVATYHADHARRSVVDPVAADGLQNKRDQNTVSFGNGARIEEENAQLRQENQQLRRLLAEKINSAPPATPAVDPDPTNTARTDPSSIEREPNAGNEANKAVPLERATDSDPVASVEVGKSTSQNETSSDADAKPVASAAPTNTVAEIESSVSGAGEEKPLTHWLTTLSHIRHNSNCRYFKTTLGRLCGPNEGKPCNLCGG